MRISDWSSDVCSSDLLGALVAAVAVGEAFDGADADALPEHLVEHRGNRRQIVAAQQFVEEAVGVLEAHDVADAGSRQAEEEASGGLDLLDDEEEGQQPGNVGRLEVAAQRHAAAALCQASPVGVELDGDAAEEDPLGLVLRQRLYEHAGTLLAESFVLG